MKIVSGKVIAGRILVEGEPLEEGSTVTVIAPDQIAAASVWWEADRPKAPDAFHEEIAASLRTHLRSA